jgi:hypothetical protein
MAPIGKICQITKLKNLAKIFHHMVWYEILKHAQTKHVAVPAVFVYRLLHFQ